MNRAPVCYEYDGTFSGFLTCVFERGTAAPPCGTPGGWMPTKPWPGGCGGAYAKISPPAPGGWPAGPFSPVLRSGRFISGAFWSTDFAEAAL